MITLATILIVIALICGALSLLGIAARVDLNAVAIILLAVAMLLGRFG